MSSNQSGKLLRGAPYFLVSDVERSLAFYEQTLGFRCEYSAGNPLQFAICSRDGLAVMLWLLVGILQMRRILIGIAFLLAISTLSAYAQTDAPPPPSPEMQYYDFWPGDWARIVNGRIDKKDIAFRVKRGVHAAAFEEEWRQVDEKGAVRLSRAIRAWDQVTDRWMFVWVSGNALFQVWEGRKYSDRWYIVREFEVGGRRFLSRQAWWPEGPDRVARVLERSFDEGKTWEVRYRAEYGRVSAEALPHKSGEKR